MDNDQKQSGGKRRPNFPLEFKRRIVEATMKPGASVALIARKHDLNANLVFKWRRDSRKGLLGQAASGAALLPVSVADPLVEPSRTSDCTPPEGIIEILAGERRVRIQGRVDPDALRLVLQSVMR